MTSAVLFSNTLKEDLRRRLWLITLVHIFFFFSFPVAIAFVGTMYGGSSDSFDRIRSTVATIMGPTNLWMAILMGGLALVSGISGYSYLFSSKKLDVYHAIPVSRKTQFWAYNLSGILIVIVSYAIYVVITLAILTVTGVMDGNMLLISLFGYLTHAFFFILLYEVVVLSCELTGHIVIAFILTGVFNYYIPTVATLLEGFESQFFSTFYYKSGSIFPVIAKWSSPFGQYFVFADDFYSDELSIKIIRVVVAIVATIVITAVAFLIHLKRPSERAGRSFVYDRFAEVLRWLIMLASGLMGFMFFYNILEYKAWGFFGVICGVIISSMIYQVVRYFDFSRIFKGWQFMIGTGVIAILITCIFSFDLLGYDRYIPNKNLVKSSAIYIDDINSWVDYNEVYEVPPEITYYGIGYDLKYKSNVDYVFEHMKLEDTEAVINLAKAGISNLSVDDDAEYDYHMYDDMASTSVIIAYKLITGRTVFRSYYLSKNDIKEQIDKLYADENYIDGLYPIYNPDGDPKEYVVYKEHNYSFDSNNCDELLAAYKQDVLDMRVSTMEDELPIGTISFYNDNEKTAYSKARVSGVEDDYSIEIILGHADYPVYPSYTRTLDLLKAEGALVGSSNAVDSNSFIEMIRKYDSHATDNHDIMITDKKEIEEILPHLYDYNYCNSYGYWYTHVSDDDYTGIIKYDIIAYIGNPGYQRPMNMIYEDINEVQKHGE